MNPNANRIYTSQDVGSSAGMGATTRPSVAPEGSEGVLPLSTHESPEPDVAAEKPSRAGQIGEGSYEGTDGYAKSIKSYLREADVAKDAAAAAPLSKSDARDMLAAEIEGASHTKAPGK